MRKSFVFCALLISTASLASAQTEKHFGLVIGYPTRAGVEWRPNGRFALRGDAGFDWGKVDEITMSTTLSIAGISSQTSTRTTRFRHSTASIGVSGLITVAQRDQLRFYLAPRLEWNTLRSSFSTEAENLGLPPGFTIPASSSSSTRNGLGADAMFGANYRLSDRFEIFGETGVSVVSPTATGSSSSEELTSYTVGSRSSLGIVIRF